jgi:hypothetical protein
MQNKTYCLNLFLFFFFFLWVLKFMSYIIILLSEEFLPHFLENSHNEKENFIKDYQNYVLWINITDYIYISFNIKTYKTSSKWSY